MDEEKKQTSFWWPEKTHIRLDVIAENMYRTRAQAVRYLIDQEWARLQQEGYVAPPVEQPQNNTHYEPVSNPNSGEPDYVDHSPVSS